MGETGVGKSTWINAFANYLKYPTIEEAAKGGLICPIPVSFDKTIDHYTLKVEKIRIGSDSNEKDSQQGDSVTQHPQTHSFHYGEATINLIDTPGTGDTRGRQQDEVNVSAILNHISLYSHLNAICVLLKPTEARLTDSFKYCLTEVLRNLHESARDNVLFCFTQTRGTDYMPGDSGSTLRAFLSSNNLTQIHFSKDNVYCFDNEAVRLLAEIEYNQTNIKHCRRYEESWETSVKATERMLQYIVKLDPHDVKNTISIASARQTNS